VANDTSFSGITDKFARNIYARSKGKIRLAVLAADLQPLLARSNASTRVIDVGAGLGQANMWFADRGAQVVHTDIAADMVQAAQHAHQQAGIEHHYHYHVAALQELPAHLQAAKLPNCYDVVICHAVLEWLENPAAALQLLADLMAPGSTLSLMFYNRCAKLFANTVYGNFDYVQSDLKVKKRVKLSPQQPLDQEWVEQQLLAHGLQINSKSGVRCFHDYLRDPKRDEGDPKLLEIELQYRRQSPYRELGRYQHWLIQK